MDDTMDYKTEYLNALKEIEKLKATIANLQNENHQIQQLYDDKILSLQDTILKLTDTKENRIKLQSKNKSERKARELKTISPLSANNALLLTCRTYKESLQIVLKDPIVPEQEESYNTQLATVLEKDNEYEFEHMLDSSIDPNATYSNENHSIQCY